jgi:hypothetical protein
MKIQFDYCTNKNILTLKNCIKRHIHLILFIRYLSKYISIPIYISTIHKTTVLLLSHDLRIFTISHFTFHCYFMNNIFIFQHHGKTNTITFTVDIIIFLISTYKTFTLKIK